MYMLKNRRLLYGIVVGIVILIICLVVTNDAQSSSAQSNITQKDTQQIDGMQNRTDAIETVRGAKASFKVSKKERNANKKEPTSSNTPTTNTSTDSTIDSRTTNRIESSNQGTATNMGSSQSTDSENLVVEEVEGDLPMIEVPAEETPSTHEEITQEKPQEPVERPVSTDDDVVDTYELPRIPA